MASTALYDSEMKGWFRARVATTRLMLGRKALFLESAGEYQKQALSNREFNGTDMTSELSRRFGCSVYDRKARERLPANRAMRDGWVC